MLTCLALPALAACSGPDSPTGPAATSRATESPSANTPDPDDAKVRLLATMNRHGGMCADGQECDWGITVKTNGSYRAWDGDEFVKGKLSSSELESLTRSVQASDFTDNQRAERDCNVEVDGFDTIITTEPTAGERVTVTTCDFDMAGDTGISDLNALWLTATSRLDTAD